MAKPKIVYFLSYGFYCPPSVEGDFAPVKSSIFVDVDGGRAISRLITDLSKWTEGEYDVYVAKAAGSRRHRWNVAVYTKWTRKPYQAVVDFEVDEPEKSNFQESHYFLTYLVRNLVGNCSIDGKRPDWLKVADKSMEVIVGYHLV